MIKNTNFFYLNSVLFLLLFFASGFKILNSKLATPINLGAQQNQAPVVKIVSPKNNSVFEWNAPVQYSIDVSDKEDGDSKYQEIAANEVFLKVKFVEESKIATELKNAVKDDPPGFAAIKTSNCLNCHAFSSKLIGPSFYEISKRYRSDKATIDLLAKHIREGSTGVWGKTVMPTHPELSTEETQNMVQWILENAAESNVSYYSGTEGFFRLKLPVNSSQKGAFVLTASYLDHGLKDKPKLSLRGQDVLLIRGK
ncbi:c-type cytochrome [Rubrolithibacter danxiaensis]|uniref:c-type cytochrome n=1 Tax=Rubrolithibacter danxiaensis TaxID=3390805 RepID=UPI003BF88053